MTDGLIYGVSTVKDGNMSLKWGKEETVNENKVRFLRKLGLMKTDMVEAWLQSGTEIKLVGKNDLGQHADGDCLITGESGVGLWMVTGDCFPVVLFEPKKLLLAAVHAGFPGINGRLVMKAVATMKEMGGETGKIKAIIGPGIRKESYRWDPEVVVQKDDPLWKLYLKIKNGEMLIDLFGYLKAQLLESGVEEGNITDSGTDTATDINYFSHYRAKRNGEEEGRFATSVMMK